MGYFELPKEERQEMWSRVGAAFDVWFGKIDVALGTAEARTLDPEIKALIKNYKWAMKGVGTSISALFASADEFLLENVTRSAEWKVARSSIRTVVSLGAAVAADALVGLAIGGPLGAVIGVVAGAGASYLCDDGAKLLLDYFEVYLPFSFTNVNKDPTQIVNASGFVNIYGDDDDNTIRISVAANSQVFGGGGNDVIAGYIYDDHLDGGEGGDIISGDRGDDTLWGGQGNDLVWGDQGDDVLVGGEGDDTLIGGNGSDEIWGDEGDDTIDGDGGDGSDSDSDTIHGGIGADTIRVGYGVHEVYGDAGDDRITGNNSSGNLDGGAGDDQINVQASEYGGMTIHGGEGQDTIRVGGGRHEVYGDDGDDHIIAVSTSGIFDGGQGDDQIDVQSDGQETRVHGGEGNDQLTGGSYADKLYGDAGNDRLSGGGGSDTLEGGDGSDTLEGGDGGDQMRGGAGYDIYNADSGDEISDSDGSGAVNLNGLQLQGGEAEGDGGDGGSNTVIEGKTYTGNSGETYVLSGGTLTIAGSSGTITIENWRQGQLGVTLRNKDDDDDDDNGGRNSPPDRHSDPLVLDLDGDGIETTSLRGNSVFFDIDGDGIRERTAWISPDDGLLALDSDGDGKITSGRELFGEGVTYAGQGRGSLTGPYGLEIKYDSGFAELKLVDDNHDGVINANDAAYASLKVWRDLNADGETDLGELLSLEESGVASISLSNSPASQSVNGNLLTSVSTYTSRDGTLAQVGDVWLRFNQRDVEHTRPEEADASVSGLPEVLGSGRVRDLCAVMAEDAILKAMVEKLASFSIAELAKVSVLVEQIILRWCGVTDGISTDFSRGVFVNGGQLAALEAWNDTPFLQNNLPNPRVDAGAILSEQWDLLHRNIAVRLIAQTPLGKQLFQEIQLVGGDFLSFATQPTSTEMLARLQANQPGGVLERLAYWHAGLRVLDTVYGSFPDVDEATYRANVENLLKGQGIDLDYYALIMARIGGEIGDGITTQSQGGGIYSSINAAARAACVVVGGQGDDNIRLGSGEQIVYYGRAQGNDLVQLGLNSLSHVEVRLVGLSISDVSFWRSATNAADLVMTVLATGETLTLTNAFSLRGAAEGKIVFDNGTTLAFSEVTAPGALRGVIGSDVLVQAAGTSELNGGAGDDILIGNAGNTTYVFERGSGHDLVKDTGFDNVVRFGPGVGPEDVRFFVDDSNFSTLYINIVGTDDVLRIENQFGGPKPIISRFEFADGGEAIVPPEDFLQALILEYYTLRGSDKPDVLRVGRSGDFHLLCLDGDDSLFGNGGHDVLEGGRGNDQLSGDDGNDTLIGGAGDDLIMDTAGGGGVLDTVGTDTILYARGDGNDRIVNYSGTGNSDRLVLQGFNPADVFLSLSANGQDIIVNVPDGSVTLQAQRYQRVWQAIGEIEFADGTVWDRLEILAHLFPESGATASLTGTDGDDILAGTAADELIQGGAGNDSLSGKAGSDTYVFGIGSGNDVITEAGTNDVLSIDRIRLTGLTPADVEIRRFSGAGDLSIRILSTGETLTVKGQTQSSEKAIEQILFEDGTVLTGIDILEQSVLSGTNAVDNIYGTNLAETIEGGGGNDFMSGYGGSDTYLWRAGAGSDTISDVTNTGSPENEVRLQGLRVADLSFARNAAGDLLVTITATGETLRISGQFTYNWWQSYGVNRLVFDDGTVLDRPALMALAPITGTDGNDSLTGTFGGETIVGVRGDDVLDGNGGGDTYVWRLWDGNDIITPGDATDVLRLHGVARSDLTFSRDPSDASNLRIAIAGTGEIITIRQQFGYTWNGSIGSIVFDDGTVMDRAQISELAALTGTAGDDVIEGTDGADVVIGGGGADTLHGGGGDDTYVWRRGDGNDTIVTYRDDTLRLDDLTAEDVRFSRKPGDSNTLLITIVATGEVITVTNPFSSSFGLDSIVFGDGSRMSGENLGHHLPYLGNAGINSFYGDGFANTLDGGAESDLLIGDQGGDLYLWRPGDGDDTIVEGISSGYGYGEEGSPPGEGWDDLDMLRLSGVTRDDLTFSRNDLNLLVQIGSTGETLTIASYYCGDQYQVEQIVLDDGQTIDLTAIAASLGLAATASDDTLIGGSGDDTLDGGTGNDLLAGGLGDDSYVVGHASDDETVYEMGGNADAIRFADGIAPESVAFRRDGDDLVAEIGGVTRGAVTIKGQFSGDDASCVEEFRFGDGTVVSWQDVEAYLLDQACTNGNDIILGYAGDDVINARGGDDTIIGGVGDDLIVGGAGRDTVVFSGQRSEYIVEVVDGRTVVTDKYYGRDGTDMLIGVENLQFAPATGSTTPVTVLLAANTAPVTGEATFAGREDHVVKLQAADLLAYASDADGDSLRLVSVSGAVGGTVALVNGMVTFTPAVNFAGEASFTYTVADSVGATITAVAKVAVAAINDAPVSATTLADTASAEDAPFSYTLPASAFTDVDGDTLALSATLAGGSALPPWLSFDPASGSFSGTPPQDFNGCLSVRVTASDGSATAEQIFDIAITAVNDAPVTTGALADASVRANDVLVHFLPIDLFTDADGDMLSYVVTLFDGKPLPAWLAFDPESRALYGLPRGTDVGSLTLCVTASDGRATALTEFTLTVESGNTAPALATPLANAASAEDGAIAFTIPAGTFADAEGDVLSLTATLMDGSALPPWLEFDAASNTFIGQPPANFNGALTVTVTASDGEYATASSFTLTVTAVNDAPVVALPVTDITSTEDTAISFTIPAGTFTDVDGDALTLTATLADGSPLPAWLGFGAANRSFSGQPPADFNGALTVTVMASDSEYSTASSFTLTVTPVNDAPVVAVPVADVVSAEDTAISFTIPAGTFTDADGDALTLTATLADGSTLPVWLSFDAATGTFSGQPPKDFHGDVVVRVSASDGALSVADEFTLAITSVNDAPIAADDSFDTLSGQQLTIAAADLLGNDSDPDDGAVLRLVSVERAANGTVALQADGSVVFIADRTFVGEASFDYVVADEHGATARGHVVVIVTSRDMSFVAGPCPENFVGASGTNTVSYENSSLPVWVDLSIGFGWLGAYGDTYRNIQNVIGSRYADVLIGDAQDNLLVGGGGGDILYGGGGRDTVSYADSNGGVTVNLATHFGQRNDAQSDFLCEIEDVLGSVFNDVLIGDYGDNRLTGGDGNDTLDGGFGDDTLAGGSGDDTYIIDRAGDLVLEGVGGGTDTVQSAISYTLGANLENLVLTGLAAVNATGNGLDNILIGNGANNTLAGGDGDDTLDGRAGRDTLVGGRGNDLYVVDNTGDVVVESAGEGVDGVTSAVTYTLGNNVENLTLTGSANLNGTGNGLDNLLVGNSGRNVLTGGAGNDTLDGGGGTDTLVGGTGNDIYCFGRGSSQDLVQENDSALGNSDTIRFGANVAADQLWFAKSGNNLVVSIIGTSDKITVENWYKGAAYHTERFETADGHVLLDAQVSNLVNAMAVFSAPKPGQTMLPKALENQLEPVIAANWH